MMQVAARIAVWVLVLGGGYLLFGPDLFDSSPSGDPFGKSASTLFLPPAKPAALVDYERRLAGGGLRADELPDYQALARDYQVGFWNATDMSVEEALSGVFEQRTSRLLSILAERGLSPDEQAVFITVVRRDSPALLEDR